MSPRLGARPGPAHPLPEILWCSDARKNRNLGWKFPLEVESLLKDFTAGRSVLHFFGGLATWGVRMDTDPITRPDVIADAYLSPFGPGSFDVVILDPPYIQLNSQMRSQLFWSARFVARAHVVWWHTNWTHPSCDLALERSWLSRVGRSSAVRCLQIFRVKTPDLVVTPVRYFTRGPQMRFNKWLIQPERLPFGETLAPAGGTL